MTDRIVQLNKERKTAKHIAVVLSVLMVSVILLSTFYVVSETNHECCDDCCPICAHIDQCNAALRSVGEGTATLVMAILFVLLVSEGLLAAAKNISLPTLITLNIRMNN